ncbi:MAG: ethanolamine ammonia-lyase light chain EutC, partial [Planctomycetota bacterium]
DLDDLDWCIDQIMPACPAYLMALPTKNDPMLSYLTTAFQDHVRIRETFGAKVNDRMWQFFQELGVLDAEGRPTEHFGQPTWVYLQYRRRRQDPRSDAEILAEGRRKIDEVRRRGVPIAEGFGKRSWDLEPALDRRVRQLYVDSKKCIWAELPESFEAGVPGAMAVRTQSQDRHDYVLHPPTGEQLDRASVQQVRQLRGAHAGAYDAQIVVSDGLNAIAVADPRRLAPYLGRLREELTAAGYAPAPETLIVRSGRVRAGYRIGELLYGASEEDDRPRAILHVIGERPGSGHHAFSVYLTAAEPQTWAKPGTVDHDITRVISGIAETALRPELAAEQTVAILRQLAPVGV